MINDPLLLPVVLTAINCYDVKWATRVQDFTTFAKVIALVIIIFAGAYELCLGKKLQKIPHIGLG
jgi:L-asparagine transporter-like permease